MFLVRLLIPFASAVAVLTTATSLHADPTTYHFDGDTRPTEGAYGSWFTTVGPNSSGISYFVGTSWASDGDVLTMSNNATNLGIWFGRANGAGDTPAFSMAATATGNWAQARLAITGGIGSPANQWSMYWYDPQGYGSDFEFYQNGFSYSYKSSPGGPGVTTFVPTDMSQFHTFTSYVLAGQVSYFFDNTYLGGGHAPTTDYVPDFFLIGDGSAATLSGIGTMYLDYVTIITGVGDNPPTPVPEPAAVAALAGFVAFGLATTIRPRRVRAPAAQ